VVVLFQLAVNFPVHFPHFFAYSWVPFSLPGQYSVMLMLNIPVLVGGAVFHIYRFTLYYFFLRPGRGGDDRR